MLLPRIPSCTCHRHTNLENTKWILLWSEAQGSHSAVCWDSPPESPRLRRWLREVVTLSLLGWNVLPALHQKSKRLQSGHKEAVCRANSRKGLHLELLLVSHSSWGGSPGVQRNAALGMAKPRAWWRIWESIFLELQLETTLEACLHNNNKSFNSLKIITKIKNQKTTKTLCFIQVGFSSRSVSVWIVSMWSVKVPLLWPLLVFGSQCW